MKLVEFVYRWKTDIKTCPNFWAISSEMLPEFSKVLWNMFRRSSVKHHETLLNLCETLWSLCKNLSELTRNFTELAENTFKFHETQTITSAKLIWIYWNELCNLAVNNLCVSSLKLTQKSFDLKFVWNITGVQVKHKTWVQSIKFEQVWIQFYLWHLSLVKTRWCTIRSSSNGIDQ